MSTEFKRLDLCDGKPVLVSDQPGIPLVEEYVKRTGHAAAQSGYKVDEWWVCIRFSDGVTMLAALLPSEVQLPMP